MQRTQSNIYAIPRTLANGAILNHNLSIWVCVTNFHINLSILNGGVLKMAVIRHKINSFPSAWGVVFGCEGYGVVWCADGLQVAVYKNGLIGLPHHRDTWLYCQGDTRHNINGFCQNVGTVCGCPGGIGDDRATHISGGCCLDGVGQER